MVFTDFIVDKIFYYGHSSELRIPYPVCCLQDH